MFFICSNTYHSLFGITKLSLLHLQDELFQQRQEGTLVEIGTNDILTQALGTSEHAGRVRAQSYGVTQRDYFLKPKGGLRQLQADQFMFQRTREAELVKTIDGMQKKFEACFEAQEQRYQEKQEEFAKKLFEQFSGQLRNLEEKLKGNQPSIIMPPNNDEELVPNKNEKSTPNKDGELMKVITLNLLKFFINIIHRIKDY